MLENLTVHEAMPGHYLQIMHSNKFKAPTMVRAIFRSGTFTEGWAVYSEQLMAEARLRRRSGRDAAAKNETPRHHQRHH